MKPKYHTALGLITALALAVVSAPVQAEDLSYETHSFTTFRDWMSPEVQDAWDQGYTGGGTFMVVVDQFKSTTTYNGNLWGGDARVAATHGTWTYREAKMIAPYSWVRPRDFSDTSEIILSPHRTGIINLSFGMNAGAGYDVERLRWSPREASIISNAKSGDAIVTKSAGNDNIAVDAATAAGKQDYLALALIGADSAIFVGALNHNGTPTHKASKTYYSNFAGDNKTVQDQYLMVGVEARKTGLAGTSFAAPIVAGYAAILGSKFRGAKESQIAQQLLDTARTDTIHNYDAAIHGRGEASLSRALAPISIR